MKRRQFRRSSLGLGGIAAVPGGLSAGMAEDVAEFATLHLDMRTGFREPVLLDLMVGDVYSIQGFETAGGKSKFGSLPLADYPLAVAERGEIALSS